MSDTLSPSLFQITLDLATIESHCYDVLIVGAGPAGSAAAYHLARMGADVLLLDRHPFPRDKPCGDAIMPPALDELALLGLVDRVREHAEQITRISTSLYGLPATYSPVQGSKLFSTGYVIPRATFDALLCHNALQAGAAWMDRVTIARVDHNRPDYAIVHGTCEARPLQLRARLVIAADGSGSRLARQLRQDLVRQGNTVPLTAPEDARARYTAMRGYYNSIDDLRSDLEFYFRIEAGTHYYWIFPLQDGAANVGVIANMVQLRAEHPNLEFMIQNFLQCSEIAIRTSQGILQGRLRAAPIASGLRGTALYGDRLLCVGDAAALVHPLSAEGISGALTSGRLAAEAALSAFNAGNYTQDALALYGTALRERYQNFYDGLLEAMARQGK